MTFAGHRIGQYENRCLFVKGLRAFFKELNVLLSQGWKPLEDLIVPLELQRCRGDDKKRPIIFVEVGDRNRLNCFTYAHLVTQQESTWFIDAKLDAFALKLVKPVSQSFRQLVEWFERLSSVVMFDQFLFEGFEWDSMIDSWKHEIGDILDCQTRINTDLSNLAN